MKDDTTYTIVELKAQNVKKLKAVRITPEGPLVIVGGLNKSGKSSVLDTIAMALGGKALCPSEPIRRGQTEAVATVDLGAYTVTRRFTASGSTVKITTADGLLAPKPATFLGGMIGNLAFDPLAFVRMAPTKQLETLRELVGLDFTQLDEKRAMTYRTRTEVGQQLKRRQAEIAGISGAKIDEAPEEEVSVAALMDVLNNAQLNNEHKASLDRDVIQAESCLDDNAREIAKAEALVTEIEGEIHKLQERHRRTAKWIQDLNGPLREKVVANIEGIKAARDSHGLIDEQPIRAQMIQAEGVNANVRLKKKRTALAEEAEGCEQRIALLTSDINAIDEEKKAALAGTTFPVDGLSFGEQGGVTMCGTPFDQASSAEQLCASVGMGLAMNPKVKVMLVHDGSLLDDNSLALLAKMAKEAGAQVWVEKVSEGEECSVVLEDGEIKKHA